ncbi:hypothetical protein, variant [Blastomyces gilchristii SLH14081]|uniref:Uncharacterized protein n=1 Tax=Blastomyces gilchristii (strain SLH14081) TaxID=559298 RepID=A0A179UGP6_BLAGS|nr:uncharacterized protein BDBG_02615 [Blastomyces gilchristii SLH14081]XP_031577205.1 hypothetical protein, variant [Blastomyces gilchristii SLH14081]OAT06408.1 hypothetical protein BDBG_02615 [Blastomyces gilchristii SLH14081]OAT06409.1 hypothetical protein, variant [Blastomyces gilchristii SLH14081]
MAGHHPPLALLLLPPPPQPLSAAALSAAYRPPLRAALQRLQRLSVRYSAQVSCDIALPYPGYTLGQAQHTFSGCEEKLLHDVQDLLLNTYTLIYSICNEQKQKAESSVNTPSPGTPNFKNVDARIILLGYDQGFSYDTLVRPARAIPSCIVDLSILALSDRNWSHLYVTEGEPGERLYRQFRALVNGNLSARVGGTWEMERVPGGMSFNMRQQSQALPGAAAPVTDGSITATKIPGHRVLVIGREERSDQEANFLLADLSQKLQLTIALLLAEFNSSAIQPENQNLDDDSGPAPPPSNRAAPEVTGFFQSIVDWRIAGDRFSKTQPASSRLRFYRNTNGSIAVSPWELIYVTEPRKQLKQIIYGNKEDGVAHMEYTVVLDESQKDSLANLIQPWNDICRLVVCKSLVPPSSQYEPHEDDLLYQN